MSVLSAVRRSRGRGGDGGRATGPLVVDRLSAGYGSRPVLRELGIRVGPGEAVALLGANGAGKTTLLRTISGMLRPSAGTITYGETDLTDAGPRLVLRSGIAHVPQGRQVFAEQTVEENLLLGALLRRDRRQLASERSAILEVFPALADKLQQKAGELSGGQQQALAIARSLMANPSLLLLDEPSIGLAPRLVDDLGELLRTLRRDRDMGILIVEQDALLALEITDRAYAMRHGEIVLERTSKALIGDSSVIFSYLGGDEGGGGAGTRSPEDGG